MDTTLIIAIAIIAGLVIILNSLFKSKKTSKTPYKYQKRNLLTKNELAFYKTLVPIATQKGLILFTKIRLADLIEPLKGSSNWQGSFSKISQKHVDFILCDKDKINPVLVIELDDKSHDRADRQQRDAFVDQVLQSVGIPILHTRNSEKLEEDIMKLLAVKTPSIK